MLNTSDNSIGLSLLPRTIAVLCLQSHSPGLGPHCGVKHLQPLELISCNHWPLGFLSFTISPTNSQWQLLWYRVYSIDLINCHPLLHNPYISRPQVFPLPIPYTWMDQTLWTQGHLSNHCDIGSIQSTSPTVTPHHMTHISVTLPIPCPCYSIHIHGTPPIIPCTIKISCSYSIMTWFLIMPPSRTKICLCIECINSYFNSSKVRIYTTYQKRRPQQCRGTKRCLLGNGQV